MKTRWSERWSWQFILAIAAMLGLMLLIGVVSEALAGHAVAAEAQVAWQAQLDRVDEALGRNDQAQALLLWREAYAAALRSRHWQGLVAVGDTYRRLGARGGFEKAAVHRAGDRGAGARRARHGPRSRLRRALGCPQARGRETDRTAQGRKHPMSRRLLVAVALALAFLVLAIVEAMAHPTIQGGLSR